MADLLVGHRFSFPLPKTSPNVFQPLRILYPHYLPAATQLFVETTYVIKRCLYLLTKPSPDALPSNTKTGNRQGGCDKPAPRQQC